MAGDRDHLVIASVVRSFLRGITGANHRECVIPVGRAPIALTFSKDHKFLYTTSQVAPSGYGWPSVCSPPASEVARQDNVLLVFDTGKVLADPAHALIGRVPVGDAPVGVAVLNSGSRVAVTNSNRFGDSTATQSLTIIDAQKIMNGEAAVLGTVPAGVFPRELAVTQISERYS